MDSSLDRGSKVHGSPFRVQRLTDQWLVSDDWWDLIRDARFSINAIRPVQKVCPSSSIEKRISSTKKSQQLDHRDK